MSVSDVARRLLRVHETVRKAGDGTGAPALLNLDNLAFDEADQTGFGLHGQTLSATSSC